MHHRLRLLPLLALSFGLISCAASYKHTVNFNPAEPLRVAVLPFVSVDSSGSVIEQDGRLLLDNLSLVSSAVEDNPAQIVRKAVIAELKKSSLDIVSTALIDIDLPHHGYGKSDGSLDIAKVIATPAKEFCASSLSCDAVLYGSVTKWERSYYGIQSVNSVGVKLTLVSAQSGAVLFEGAAEDSSSRGLTKGPTGFSDLILEPIKGLDSEIINTLAVTTVQKLLEPLVTPVRPDFVDHAPPAIFAASHDNVLSHTAPLIVVAFASEDAVASFSIGDFAEGLPMLERSPGHYYGEYNPLPSDAFSQQPVIISLTDKHGRTSTYQIPKAALSLK